MSTWVQDTHAAFAIAAWVVFFPIGSIIVRTLHTPKTWLIHAIVQTFATALLIIGVAFGIKLAIDTQQLDEYHCIIGLVLFGLVFFQAGGGILHHLQFRKTKKPTALGWSHVWLGRASITLGMINGGFGLQLTGEDSGSYIAYGVVVGLFWLVWMGIDLWATFKGAKQQQLAEKERNIAIDSEWQHFSRNYEGKVGAFTRRNGMQHETIDKH